LNKLLKTKLNSSTE